MGTEENFDDSFLHIFQPLAGEDNPGAHTCEPGCVDAAGPTPPPAPEVDMPNCFHETAPFDHASLLPDPAWLAPAYDAAMAGHDDDNDVILGVSGESVSSPPLSVVGRDAVFAYPAPDAASLRLSPRSRRSRRSPRLHHHAGHNARVRELLRCPEWQ
jgi:hypothetical protein